MKQRIPRKTVSPAQAKRVQAVSIIHKLRKAGHEAYFVGGCVRDEVLRIAPKDYDIATSARPEVVMKLFKKTIPVGVQFGVILVVERGENFEVATFRSDGEYLDSRRPQEVHFSNAKEDVLRRDFTINGLLYDPRTKKIMDYVGGLKDIREKVLRTIGDPRKRFAEDKLRLIRAIRFACRFNFSLQPETFRAIREAAGQINKVSQERIRDELVKILTGKNVGRALDMLRDSGLLRQILPEVEKMIGVQQPPEFHPEGDVYVHTKLLFEHLKRPSPVLALGALLHDVGKPDTFRVAERIRFDGHVEVGVAMAEKILRRLRFSNAECKKVTTLVATHMKFKDVRQMRENRLKRFLQSDVFTEELAMHRADCLASHGNLENWEFCKKKLEEFGEEEIRPKPLLTGHDLIAMGYKPGPLFKKILTTVEDAQLENRAKSKRAAKALVRTMFSPIIKKAPSPLAGEGRDGGVSITPRPRASGKTSS